MKATQLLGAPRRSALISAAVTGQIDVRRLVIESCRMSLTPKTIQIYLPGGDPRGIRVAEITTRIVQVIEVPRSLLSSFSLWTRVHRAVYF